MGKEDMGKSALVLAIGKPKGGDDEEAPPSSRMNEEAEGDSEESAAFEESADMLFDAAKKGDRKGFRSALKAAIYACMEE